MLVLDFTGLQLVILSVSVSAAIVGLNNGSGF